MVLALDLSRETLKSSAKAAVSLSLYWYWSICFQVHSHGSWRPSLLHWLHWSGSSFVRHVNLSSDCSLHGSCFSQCRRSQREKMPTMKTASFYKLISEVACHHFCCMPLTTPTNPGSRWEGVNAQWQGLLGLSWRPAGTVDIQCVLEVRLYHQFSSFYFAAFNLAHDMTMSQYSNLSDSHPVFVVNLM